MKITRDNNNNVSYTLETNDIYAQQIIDYWTPEKKAKAIPIMPCIEDEIEQPNIVTLCQEHLLRLADKIGYRGLYRSKTIAQLKNLIAELQS